MTNDGNNALSLIEGFLPPADLVSFLSSMTSREGWALLLYGSFARGTASDASDIDVIQLVKRSPRSYSVGRINVNQYLPSHLRDMFTGGSLFALHLVTEGRILRDPSGELGRILESYVSPPDYRQLRESIARVATVLDPKSNDLHRYYVSLVRLGLYLIRTTMYLDSVASDIHTFDIDVLSLNYSDTRLIPLLTLRRKADAELSAADVGKIYGVLGQLLPTLGRNATGSVEARVIQLADDPFFGRMLARMLVGETTVSYTDLSTPAI